MLGLIFAMAVAAFNAAFTISYVGPTKHLWGHGAGTQTSLEYSTQMDLGAPWLSIFSLSQLRAKGMEKPSARL
jgi:hypothetical protein